MPRFKDFGIGSPAENTEPISFKLWGEEFHCVTSIQGKLLLEIVSDSSSDDPAKSALVMDKFFNAVLKPDSKKRFDEVLSDSEKITTLDTLGDIVGWLMEEYSNRPKEQSTAS